MSGVWPSGKGAPCQEIYDVTGFHKVIYLTHQNMGKAILAKDAAIAELNFLVDKDKKAKVKALKVANAIMFVTDFVDIKLGPKLAAVFNAEGLSKNKNTKAYKLAKTQRDFTDDAIRAMAKAYYWAGVELPKELP